MRRFRLTLSAAIIMAAPISAVAEEGVFPEDLPHACTYENVAGVFGANEDTLSGAGNRLPQALLGVLDLRPDGTAGLALRGFGIVGGPSVSTQEPLEGEWTIEPNCFGFIDFPVYDFPAGRDEVDFLFVAVENGSELFFIQNNPLEAGDAKLLFRP